MAKMRVYDLAKELGIESKQIIETLNTTEYAVKAASSNVDDPAQEIVRKKFGKSAAPEKKAQNKENAPENKPADNKAAAPENKPVQKPQANEQTKSAENAEQRPKKKSSITAVFNAQYSKQGNNRGGNNNRRPGNGDRRPGNGERRPQGQNQNRGNAQARPTSGYDVRKAFERAINPEAAKAAEEAERLAAAKAAELKAQRDAKPAAEEPKKPVETVQVQTPRENVYAQNPEYRPQNNDRRQGNNNDRRDRNNNGQRRPQGDGRNQRNNGDRPQRPYGDRNGRNDGQRPYQNNGRPGQGQGDRNNNRNNGFRGGNNGGGRLDREIDRFNKEAAAAAPEELRGKESRERDKDRNKNARQRNDYDALGGKKQERFINLEKNGGKKKPQQQPKQQPEEDAIRTLVLPEKLTIRELADKMKVQPSVIVKKLFLKGTMVTVNQEVDYEQAEEIALEFNCICEPEEKVDVIAELLKEEDDPEDTLVARPPVVCVMGHVDHGKTSLLDAIRSTRVTDREAGGITQHIGASVVSINGQNITFLDTPGHEAFTAMRMRGANSTDIAILVVAADDGVMPQTVEAINHAKAAGVEIIVAINKIDKPSANIERVKQELSEYELIPEDWGGSTIFCPVSAHTKEGIDNLLEMILLTAEVLELKANPKRNARGLVIEAQLDKGRGAVATVLVQKGTLKVGQPVACGSCYGKVRAMIDDQGRRVKEAGPSMPVEILGLSSVPEAGETFVAMDTEKEARAFAETYISEGKNRLIEDTKAKMSLDDLFSQIQSGNVKELDIIVKADVQGSVEAVKQSLVKLSNEEVVVKVIHGGVGAINESDVSLASASNAIIIGFNVRPDPTAKLTADKENVDIRLYKVIYNAIEDVEAAMKGMLDPVYEEKVLGHAEIRQIFKASGVGNIAGSYVLDGMFQRGCKVRISREGEQIFEGDLASLKRFKDDVKEVKAGFECGLVFEGFGDFQELDIVEAYTMVEVPR
ncbi:translation initiation factor IF-2 [Roseburia rectibacter]|jgi:translation initiation factor IF-2|uniref:translation initiation factor IF-2 n=1 Tax=Roseburia rectibacter TaxID=2763062 RepID=UPI00164C48A8|nr:translation initiation factor IF-2 [Roseburia rectibacter]UMY98558.1 translation initiation factor IF-2 [Roseburia rectibacter]